MKFRPLKHYLATDFGVMSKCTCKLQKKLLDMIETNKLIDFLMGLLNQYDNMKGNILSMAPLPYLNRAFHLVQQVEKQKQLSGEVATENLEVSAFQVNKQDTENFQRREFRKDKVYKRCDYCGIKGHIKSDCYKIIGYPERSENTRGRNGQDD